MKFEQAQQLLNQGKKVRLPEWTGYWFTNDRGYYMAFTRTGDIFQADIETYSSRTDWEEVTVGLGFDWALLAAKSGKKVRREGWPGFVFIDSEGLFLGFIEEGEDKIRIDLELLDHEDLLATDWVLAD